MVASRIALVLGAGGSVGHAFHSGVLSVLAEELGWDARTAEVIVGTSVGSVVGVLLRAGMPVEDLANRAMNEAMTVAGATIARRAMLNAPERPPRRGPSMRGGPASRTRLAAAALRPWTATPGSIFAAAMPAGKVPTEMIAGPMASLFGDEWPEEAFYAVAVDLDSGARVVFGREGSPPATVSEAVQASCAVPSYFAPVEIGDRRYVDGGVHSTSNADLVGDHAPDLVIVSVPMSIARSAGRPSPSTAMRQVARMELAREAAALRRKGIPVVAFSPSAEDLATMGGDTLDPSKMPAVCAAVRATTRRRLARGDVRERLAALL